MLSCDKDYKSYIYGKKIEKIHSNFFIKHNSYSNIKYFIDKKELLDGAILDLGFSLDQLQDNNRGFSFSNNTLIDMRFDISIGKPTYKWINKVSYKELSDIIYYYGEERLAKKIARNIIKYRPIYYTYNLSDIIKKTYLQTINNIKKIPLNKTFQAIRIFVNNELNDLVSFFNIIPNFMKQHSRLGVISFHSLEDRIVKHYTKKSFRKIGKIILPTTKEILHNPCSKSAKLRNIRKKIIFLFGGTDGSRTRNLRRDRPAF